MIPRSLFILRRRWPVIVALVVVGAVAGLAVGGRGTANEPPAYTADALVSVNQASANQTEVQQALIEARQGTIAANVAAQLGGTDADDVARGVTASFDPDSYVSTITARAATRDGAEELLTAFTEAFVADGNGGASADQEARMAEAVAARDAAQGELRAFRQSNAEVLAQPDPPLEVVTEETALQSTADAAGRGQRADQPPAPNRRVRGHQHRQRPAGHPLQARPVREPALSPDPRHRPGPRRRCRGDRHRRAGQPPHRRSRDRGGSGGRPGAGHGAPPLARGRRRLIERADPGDFRGPYAEAFRTLRSHLDFRSAAEERTSPPRIMVTSAAPSEGKSTTTALTALAYAETDTSPVVVGGDLRRPTIHRIFGVDRVPGLTSRSLPGGRSVPLTTIVRRDPVTGVTLIPSGPTVDNVVDVTRDLRAVTEVAQQSGQVVLLDTAPVRVANDAVDFLPAVDWVVVAVQAGTSSQRAVRQTVETLRRNGAVIVGLVMIGAAEAADASRDYYAYYAPDPKPRRARRGERASDMVDISDDQLLDHDPTAPTTERAAVGV